jgi:hypoxanthine phosphoribosyltransferase
VKVTGDILIPEDRIAARVLEMATAIDSGTAAGASLSVLAILDGAFMFCADLIRHLRAPVHLAMVPVRSVARGGNPSLIRFPERFPVKGADLLVVEDILDTGRTLSALVRHLQSFEPRSLRIAVLLDKPSRREVMVRPDYTGFEVPDRWVVGYGLDEGGLYRNLPYITTVGD